MFIFLFVLKVMGNSSEFKNAVQLVLDTVSFDKPSTIQVFEANIRYVKLLIYTVLFKQCLSHSHDLCVHLLTFIFWLCILCFN